MDPVADVVMDRVNRKAWRDPDTVAWFRGLEGWTDPGGTDVVRRDLTEEAIFLARLVAELLPEQPEALGLLALMFHAEARRHTRRSKEPAYLQGISVKPVVDAIHRRLALRSGPQSG